MQPALPAGWVKAPVTASAAAFARSGPRPATERAATCFRARRLKDRRELFLPPRRSPMLSPRLAVSTTLSERPDYPTTLSEGPSLRNSQFRVAGMRLPAGAVRCVGGTEAPPAFSPLPANQRFMAIFAISFSSRPALTNMGMCVDPEG